MMMIIWPALKSDLVAYGGGGDGVAPLFDAMRRRRRFGPKRHTLYTRRNDTRHYRSGRSLD